MGTIVNEISSEGSLLTEMFVLLVGLITLPLLEGSFPKNFSFELFRSSSPIVPRVLQEHISESTPWVKVLV